MSYSIAGSLITQASGTTDNDLSGLANIAGVTVFNGGIRSMYILDGLQLEIRGTQTINPFNECIFTQNFSSNYNVRNYGTLTINGYRNYSSALQNSKQPWLISSEDDNNFCFFNTGALVWTGGAIDSKRGVRLFGDVTLDTIVGDCVHVNRFEFGTDNLTINGPITLQGFRASLNNNKPITNLVMTGARGIDFTSVAGRNNIGGGLHYILTDFVYTLSNLGCNLRYFNTADFINTKTGSELEVLPAAAGTNGNNGGVVAVYKNIKFNVKDLSGNNLQGAKVYFSTYNDGNRVDVSSSFGAGFNFTATDIFSMTTDSSGNTSTSKVLLVAHTLATTNANDLNVSFYSKNGNTTDLYTVDYYKYGYIKSQLDVSMKDTGEKTQGFVSLPDLSISENTKTTVTAYATIETSAKFYDRAASYLEDNFNTIRAALVSRSGIEINAGAYNVTIDATASSAFNLSGNLITIKASSFAGDMTTTGIITLSNGATFIGTRTDTNGTIKTQQFSVTGLVAGSRLRVYNKTTSAQVVNEVVSGTSYTGLYPEGTGYSVGNVLDLRATKIDKLEFSVTVVVGSTGWNSLVSQSANPVYAAHGVNGATVSGISWDSGNLQFDFNDADNQINGADIGAWYYYFITTEVGIAEAFKALNWPQINKITNVTSNVSMTFDNTKSTPLRINNCWIDKDNGSSIIATASNSIQIDPPAVFVAQADSSGLTPEQATELTGIKTKTDLLNFTGADIKATLDGEAVVTDTASRNASKADLNPVTAELGKVDTSLQQRNVNMSEPVKKRNYGQSGF